MSATADTGETNVLEFRVGEEAYCVEIEYVTEIVDGGQLTAIPKTAAHVAGVMDLRGRTTTIVDPRILFGNSAQSSDAVVTDGGETHNRVVIFDPETVATDGQMGWLVSDVAEVTHISEETVHEGPVSDIDLFHGVVKRDDDFLLWVDPAEITIT